MCKQRFWTGVLTVLITVMLAAFAQATILSPLSVTGFNYDIMYGSDGGQGGGYAAAVDPWGQDAFFATGTMDAGGATHDDGLPVGNFTSATDADHTYCLADAGDDAESVNSLGLQNGAVGTLTLAVPGRFDTLGVLATTCSGGESGLSLVLNYSDGSHSSGLTYDAPDWGNLSAPNAAIRVSRHSSDSVSLDGFVYDGSHPNRFALYETVVEVDPNKTLQSVTFIGTTVFDGDYARTQIMAISGHEIPEPSTLTLLAAGLVGLLAYAWRKRK